MSDSLWHPWTIACQAPLSTGFSRWEYWTELPFLSPGDLPNPGIKPRSPTLQADSLPTKPPGKCDYILTPSFSTIAFLNDLITKNFPGSLSTYLFKINLFLSLWLSLSLSLPLSLSQPFPLHFIWYRNLPCNMGFPCGSAGKESACNVEDLGLIPGLGRSPGEGKGYPFQHSGLENSIDCIVHGVAKSRTRLSNFHLMLWIPLWFKVVLQV